jgi:hypothetical protein
VEDVGSAGGVEHIRAIKETGVRLAVVAVADEAETAGGGDVAGDAAHAAAAAAKRKVQRHAWLISSGRKSVRFDPIKPAVARTA